MAQLKRWDIKKHTTGSYPVIASKKPQAISIGFEWEVQSGADDNLTESESLHYEYNRRVC